MDAALPPNALAARRVLLIVSGGIAAYKAPDVVRRLRDAGAEVQVVMTPAAGAFITPLTLQAVSGAKSVPSFSTRLPKRPWATSSSRAGPTSS